MDSNEPRWGVMPMRTWIESQGTKPLPALAVAAAILLGVATVSAQTAVTGVGAMPAREAWSGTAVHVWGALQPAPVVGAQGTYTWSFTPNDKVTVAAGTLAGNVSDARDIGVDVTFALVPPATSALVQANLTIMVNGAEYHKSTQITVLSPADVKADTPEEQLEINRRIAIERGLHYLFRTQYGDGSWYFVFSSECVYTATTAVVLWAFANNGHRPANDPTTDVYQFTVQAALDFLLRRSRYYPLTITAAGDADENKNGVAVILGGTNDENDTYGRGMAVAALCACGNPERITHVAPFDNQGQGTTYLEIIQDSIEAVAFQLGYGGGWGYSFPWGNTDCSIASWQFLAFEAAVQSGAHIPGWVPSKCDDFLSRAWAGSGYFYYHNGAQVITPAAMGAGLTGLSFVTIGGRTPQLPAGLWRLQNLAQFADNWDTYFDWYVAGRIREDAYWMWTVARALRMANITKLRASSGMEFDWQRHTGGPNHEQEGFWPFLIRLQLANGSWALPNSRRIIDQPQLETAFCVLTLTEGVIGEKKTIRNVEVTSLLPKNGNAAIDPASHAGQVPELAEAGNGQQQLTWHLGDMAEGSTRDLSYDQILSHLQAGEVRRVQDAVTVSYSSGETGVLEQHYGSLDVTVQPSRYGLTVQSAQPSYTIGNPARFDVTASLPTGQSFYRLESPATGEYVLQPSVSDSGAAWTELAFTVVNAAGFGAAETPVRIRVKSGANAEDLARQSYGPAIASSPAKLGVEPSRYLAVEVTLTPNAQGVLPKLDSLYLFFNHREAKVQLEIVDAAGAAQPLAAFTLFPQDYGQTVTLARFWDTSGQAPGARTIRARLVEGNTTAVEAHDEFALVQTGGAAAPAATVTTDKRRYSANEIVLINSLVSNPDVHLDLANLAVQLRLRDPNGQLVAGAGLDYGLATLSANSTNKHLWLWPVGTSVPGTYTVEQTVSPQDLPSLSASTAFEVLPSAQSGNALVGRLTVQPQQIYLHEPVDLSLQASNSGNVALPGVTLKLEVLSPETMQPLRSLTHAAALEIGGETAQTFAQQRLGLPPGNYPLTLTAVYEYGGQTYAQPLDAAGLAIRNRPPVADAGPDQVLAQTDAQGAVATLDGSRSTDPDSTNPPANDDDLAAYAWHEGETLLGSGKTLMPVLALGPHTITLTVTDQSGAQARDTVQVTVEDRLAPVTAHDYAARQGQWFNAAQTVLFTATDNPGGSGVKEVLTRLGEAPVVTTPGNTASVNVAAEGKTSIVYQARDQALNLEAPQAVEVWLDFAAPVLAHDFTHDGQWQGAATVIAWSATDALSGVAAAQWRLDGGAWQEGSPVTVAGAGQHLVELTATDLAGNQAGTTLNVWLDLEAPVLAHDYLQDGQWLNAAPTITWTATDAQSGIAAAWSVLDAGAAQPPGPVAVTGAGPHTLELHARDGVGRESQQTLTVKLDLTPPVTTTNYALAGQWTNQDAAIMLAATDDLSGVATTSYSRDGVTTVGTSIAVTTEGSTVLAYRSRDVAGNVEADQTLTVKLDKTAPVIAHDFADPEVWRTAAVAVQLAVADQANLSGVASWQYAINGGTPVANDPVVRLTQSGTFAVQVQAADRAGNTGASQFMAKLDLDDPVVTHDYAQAGVWATAPQTIRWNATDATSGVASVWYELNGQRTVASQVAFTQEGQYALTVGASDVAGRETRQLVQVWLRTPTPDDVVPPTITDLRPDGSQYYLPGTTTISAKVADSGSGINPASMVLTLNGQPVAAVYDPATGTVGYTPAQALPDGNVAVGLTVADMAGNVATATWSYSIRTIAACDYEIFAAGTRQELKLSGGEHAIYGAVRSNDDAKISGGHNRIFGTLYVHGTLSLSGAQNQIAAIVRNAPVQPLPVYDLAYFRRNAHYVHAGPKFQPREPLPEGIHFVNGSVKISTRMTAHVTIVATGDIELSGSGSQFLAYDASRLLFYAGGDIKISGSSHLLGGVLYAPEGEFRHSGSNGHFPFGRIWAREVELSGAQHLFGCPPPPDGHGGGCQHGDGHGNDHDQGQGGGSHGGNGQGQGGDGNHGGNGQGQGQGGDGNHGGNGQGQGGDCNHDGNHDGNGDGCNHGGNTGKCDDHGKRK